MENVSEEGLVRGIRRWDLIAVAISSIIGAGIFGLPSDVYATTGAYSLLAFAASALIVTLIILCFAEVGSRFSETGGPYLYAREAFGAVAGFEVGWLLWLRGLPGVFPDLQLSGGFFGLLFSPPGVSVARRGGHYFVLFPVSVGE